METREACVTLTRILKIGLGLCQRTHRYVSYLCSKFFHVLPINKYSFELAKQRNKGLCCSTFFDKLLWYEAVCNLVMVQKMIMITGVTQESATRNDVIMTIPVNISRLMWHLLNRGLNSSIRPVITHSKPPI